MAPHYAMGGEPLPPGQVTDPEKLTTDEVRQGVTGNGVRYVLIFSLAGAIIAMAAAWMLIPH
jgi:hypothetical protein